MKKWLYLIAPAVMLGVFMVFYFSYVEKAHAKEAAAKAKVEQTKKDADEKKKVAESKAREDAKKRQDERDAEERKKEKERTDKQASEDKKVRDATNEFLAKGKTAEDEGKKLEANLSALRTEKDKITRESFDIAKQVELARIARRNAELEIQRYTEMISKRASDSSLTRLPVIPPPPAPAKQ
ncbi:MAG: hypothetical protein V4773_06240 [Verrucomicrobiota bacterium]